jgi:hypothetical protein
MPEKMDISDADRERLEEMSQGPQCTCGCPKKHSFDPDTRVLMADGTTKAIKDVQVGDEVLATDPETGETTVQTVTDLHVNLDRELTDLTLVPVGEGLGDHTTRGPTTTLETTQNHPFWDVTTGMWIDASQLVPGDSVVTSDTGELQLVVAVDNYVGAAEMRDLTVSTIHTYYVLAGSTPALVHNVGGLPSALGVIAPVPSGPFCPIANRDEYYDMSTEGATPDVKASLEEYARRANAWLRDNGPQTVVSTRLQQAQIRAAIRAERTRNPHLYPPGIVPGHVPDTAVTGMPEPPGGWLPQPARANSIAGGGLSSRIGTVLRGYLVDGVYLI